MAPLEKSFENFLRSVAVDGRRAASRRSSQVHPSLCASNFFGIPKKASVTALKDMTFFAGRMDEKWVGM
jgi:hypothetical protein